MVVGTTTTEAGFVVWPWEKPPLKHQTLVSFKKGPKNPMVYLMSLPNLMGNAILEKITDGLKHGHPKEFDRSSHPFRIIEKSKVLHMGLGEISCQSLNPIKCCWITNLHISSPGFFAIREMLHL